MKKSLLKFMKKRRKNTEYIYAYAMSGKYTEKQIEAKILEAQKRELGY